jgi:hypothetical protein
VTVITVASLDDARAADPWRFACDLLVEALQPN